MKVLITGASGQLGSTMTRMYADRADVVGLTRRDLDIGHAGSVEALVARERPDAIINCAAYNDVDAAEAHAADALRVNAMAVRGLARAACRSGATLVHYGTDFVFDGTLDRAYTEADEPAPCSVYGASKLLGEWFAADAPRHYVLRLASVFGGDRRGSRIDRIADAMRRGDPPRVFVDRTVTPSYAPDVAEATWRLLAGGAPPGVYHCVNSGETHWFALAEEIARRLGAATAAIPARVAEVATPARRPQFAALSNAKLTGLGIHMPRWQDAVSRHLTGSAAS